MPMPKPRMMPKWLGVTVWLTHVSMLALYRSISHVPLLDYCPTSEHGQQLVLNQVIRVADVHRSLLWHRRSHADAWALMLGPALTRPRVGQRTFDRWYLDPNEFEGTTCRHVPLDCVVPFTVGRAGDT